MMSGVGEQSRAVLRQMYIRDPYQLAFVKCLLADIHRFDCDNFCFGVLSLLIIAYRVVVFRNRSATLNKSLGGFAFELP